MSRQKNRGHQMFSPSYSTPTRTARRWKMASYIRLSKEDLQKIKKGLDCSNSVKNQRDILNYFYQSHVEEFESVTEYVDDGHTGTDTDREQFQAMMADIMNRKINCVVVKDLSRLARNYSDAGSLLGNLFVQMGIRFISLAENVDSFLDPDSVSDIKVPITNVMNDNYCFQTSKKIRQVFDYKRRSGQYIGSMAPFGYKGQRGQAQASGRSRCCRNGQADLLHVPARQLQAGRVAPPERTRHTQPLGLPAHEGPACFLRCGGQPHVERPDDP